MKIYTQLKTDNHYRIVLSAVGSLIYNLLFAFYNGILGITSSSLIFIISSIYYLLLSGMRFSAVILNKKPNSEQHAVSIIGVMLIILGIVLHIMVIVSISHQTATPYDTITMITIATFTFSKIGAATRTAVKHRSTPSRMIKAINVIRYSEVAVSLLTMQQSMLVSFGKGNDPMAIILNACTGAAVCIFILTLGIITLKNNRKED